VANYLTIPEIVESEPLLSLTSGHDGKTFSMLMNVGDTTVQLMRANIAGQNIPLVVLTTDAQILALDSVYVTDMSVAANSSEAYVTMLAEAVRFV
jgi:hypothetical protein